jgi:antitoxin PrlF
MESRVSSKGQVTIPRNVREALGLRRGDTVAYEIRGSAAVIRKRAGFDAAFHKALAQTLDEWTTPEDDEAFRDL